jgi:two-component system chemotaxis response regulator CheB
LAKLLPDLAGRITAPIFIIQHNLNGLSSYMAESLSRRVGSSITEANEGLVVARGGIYLAQSGSHMILRRVGSQIVIGLSDAPPENHSRPSVDVFLRSATAIYGSSLIAAILTGMLNDGANGVRAVKRAGGFVIAQDQATSVIWGMPRAAIETGAVDAILSLENIAPTLVAMLEGKSSR